MVSKTLIWFAIGFFLTLGVSLYLISSYVGLDLTQDVVLPYALISLIVGLIFAGSARGKTHFGHLPFLLGLVLSFWAGTALFGNLELTSLKKPLWWIIEDPSVKRNLAIVWFAGTILFFAGIKLSAGNLYFWRPFGKGR